MSVHRVYPSEVAASGFLDRDPDTATEFAPVNAQGDETPAEEAPWVDPEGEAATAAAAEPEPAPARPEVVYADVGGTRAYKLLYPVRIDGKRITGLTIHPPALWDIQDWIAGRLKTNYELMARMVDMDPVALGALRWPDIQAITDITTPMLPDAVREAIEAARNT